MARPNYDVKEPDVGNVLGCEVALDDVGKYPWHWYMSFPLVTEDNEKAMNEEIETQELLDALFTKRSKDTGLVKNFQSKMRRRDLVKSIATVIVDVFASEKGGLNVEKMITIDQDEMFLLFNMPEVVVADLCQRHAFRVNFKPDSYSSTADSLHGNVIDREFSERAAGLSKKHLTCPTDRLDDKGQFVVAGVGGAKPVPGYTEFDKEHYDKKLYEWPLREVDIIKLMRIRFSMFFHNDVLSNDCRGCCNFSRPVHRYFDLKVLHDKYKWNSFHTFWRFPSHPYPVVDKVREYFGEEQGFFFLWISFYSRWLCYASVLAGIYILRGWVFPEDWQEYSQYGFAGFMIMWGAFFNCYFRRLSNQKSLEWGMKNFKPVAQVRKEFRREYRNTLAEATQNTSHWVLAFVFIAETFFFQFFRDDFHRRCQETQYVYGIPRDIADPLSSYLLTINIKVVDIMWSTISPRITDRENWKTRLDLKAALIDKLFIVKAVVNYYPFFYIAFIQDHVDGCGPGKDSCEEHLRKQLWIFFISDGATNLVTVLFQIWLIRRAMAVEVAPAASTMKKRTRQGRDVKMYTYLQAQSKYSEEFNETDAFMTIITSMGFVIMFAVVVPPIMFLAFFLMMTNKQLLAYQISYCTSRPIPFGQEGIGAWAGIVDAICRVAIITNCGIACFQMYPMKQYNFERKFTVFFMWEHVLFGIYMIIQNSLNPENAITVAITERQEDAFDDIVGLENKPVFLPKTVPPLLTELNSEFYKGRAVESEIEMGKIEAKKIEAI